MDRYKTALNELENAKRAFVKEGMGDFARMVDEAISAMRGYGSLYSPQRKNIVSITRMLMENGISNSEAESYLENAYECFEDPT